MKDSFSTRRELRVADRSYRIASLPALAAAGHDLDRLPFATRVLLENLLRREDGEQVTAADVEAVAGWDPAEE